MHTAHAVRSKQTECISDERPAPHPKDPPTFIDRRYTNQKVLDILQTDHHHLIEKFSLTWMTRNVKLLGHILRTDSKDPMRQVMLDPCTNRPRPEYRRPGKPRASLLLETIKDAFALLGRSESYDYTNNEHRQYLIQQARTRQGIFATKPQDN